MQIPDLLPVMVLAAAALTGPASTQTNSYQDAVLADAPVSLWSLDQPAGSTAVDLRGINHGTYLGGPLLDQAGAFACGRSVFLDGVDDYIRIPHTPSLNFSETFTLELWIKPDDNTATAYVLDKDFDRYSVIIGFQGGDVNFFKGNYVDGSPAPSQLPVASNAWSHVVYTKGSNGQPENWRGYVNGVEIFRLSRDFTLNTNTNDLFLGATRPYLPGFPFFRGGIDEVAVYDHDLSAERVAAHYAAAVSCTENSPPSANAGPNLTIDSGDQSTTTIHGAAGDGDIGDVLTCRWLEGTTVLAGPTTLTTTTCPLDLGSIGTLSLGDHTLTLEINDGTETVTDDMVLTVANSAPTAAPSGAGSFELGTASNILLNGDVADFDGDQLVYEWRALGSTTAIASGTILTIAGGDAVTLPQATIGTTTLGLGVHTIELAVDDGVNAEVVASIEVEVKDTIGPTLALECSNTILWPPNHAMMSVTVNPNATDEGGAVTISGSVASNEPVDGTGDGDTAPDWSAVTVDGTTGLVSLDLRAERSGSGSGRIYTVTITATDASGNQSIASCEIVVPKSKGRNK